MRACSTFLYQYEKNEATWIIHKHLQNALMTPARNANSNELFDPLTTVSGSFFFVLFCESQTSALDHCR